MSSRGVAGIVLIAACLMADTAHAQFGVPWQQSPKITVIGADSDPRQPFIDEAVAFWNRTLEELGSGFRLGSVERISRPIPEKALQALSQSIISGARPVDVPQALRDLPGDLTVLLADSEFVSFAGPFHALGKRVVGIKSPNWPPLNIPNVARNVITHELGHAIGLGHNGDPAMLMCGRPASCRPAAFRSDVPRIFPLTDDEKAQLLRMYPADWKPRSTLGAVIPLLEVRPLAIVDGLACALGRGGPGSSSVSSSGGRSRCGARFGARVGSTDWSLEVPGLR